ncbi:MAG: hypothetical protein ABI679_09630 [Gemmatimonadota bacterium]
MNPHFRLSSRGLFLGLVVLAMQAELAVAQGSMDPSVAPRAVNLERQGDRVIATEMLGRYLATAPDDGVAWFHLGRFYLADERDWHLRGHTGEPSGPLYLDFAATALDQAIRLVVDSAVVYRLMVEMDRARLYVETFGWDAARERRPRETAPQLPDYILELGANLLASCPDQGVLLTGDNLETVAVWYASLETGRRNDVLPLEPRLYTTDSLYRAQIASALGVDPNLPVRQAIAAVAARRPICLTPMADTAAVPFTQFTPVRLVRVNLSSAGPTDDVLTVTELVQVEHMGGTVWTTDIRRIYAIAAGHNSLLCSGLLQSLGDRPLGACGH